MKFGIAVADLEAVLDVVNFVSVLARDVHRDFAVIGPDHADIAGADIKAERHTRRKLGLEMRLAGSDGDVLRTGLGAMVGGRD